MPPIHIAFNEPLDPTDLEAFDPGSHLGLNVQLWRVGDVAGNPVTVTAANQVQTNRPIVVQRTLETIIHLIPIVDQPSGTYLVNVRDLTDLPGNALVTSDSPSPAVGGCTAIDAAIAGVVPSGYRFYFRTP